MEGTCMLREGQEKRGHLREVEEKDPEVVKGGDGGTKNVMRGRGNSAAAEGRQHECCCPLSSQHTCTHTHT